MSYRFYIEARKMRRHHETHNFIIGETVRSNYHSQWVGKVIEIHWDSTISVMQEQDQSGNEFKEKRIIRYPAHWFEKI